MSLPFYLSRRIYAGGNVKRQASLPAIRIATMGVAVGLAVMIISVSVVLGFKQTIRDKVAGFGGHIEVANFMTLHTSTTYPIEAGDSLLGALKEIPGVKHAERFSMTGGILKTDADFLGVTLKGVAEEWDSTFIHDNMIEGSIPAFSGQESSGKVVVSKTIADKLQLTVGERVFAYFFDGSDGVRTRRFTISGIYETNLAQYDNTTCLTDLYTSVKLNGWEGDMVTGIAVKANRFEDIDIVEEEVAKRVNRTTDDAGGTYSSKTIKEINPQIFAWLDLLDMNVWIILILMILVASVTICSGLLIIILERTSMIGTLKALGARGGLIRRTFLWFGVFIIGKGMLLGDILAIALLLIQVQWGVVRLNAETYYVSTVPVTINLPVIAAINVATLIISFLALVLPSYLVSHIKPAKAIKFD